MQSRSQRINRPALPTWPARPLSFRSNIMRWTIHLTVRDSWGNVTHHLLGDHVLSELPDALEIAMQRAKEARAAIQVVREPVMPGFVSSRSP
jgi:hypothetical protein